MALGPPELRSSGWRAGGLQGAGNGRNGRNGAANGVFALI